MKKFLIVLALLGFASILPQDRVVQTKLANGLTVLVCPVEQSSMVSIQLWYNVGSKHEKTGQRGIAHFIEHMIFKGTEKISESDIDLVARKLSGNCNAFTWYDYTGYLFNIPVANWDKVLPMMADCMQNCTFCQDHLNSELKAVIQEMKMIHDQHSRDLRENMISHIFQAHPYHYSTIGFKQDLWTVNRDTLVAFYKKYYTPDNAAIIVVGNVDPQDVHAKVEQAFGNIPAGNGWNQEEFYHNEDVCSKTVQLYRDVQQATCNLAYIVPGVKADQEFELEVLAHIIGSGKNSRLYKVLVDELRLVVDVQAMIYDMFDYGILFIEFHPKSEKDIDMIVQKIQEVFDDIACNGPTLQEVQRADRFVQIDFQHMLENTQQQAYAIGKSFIASQDPCKPFKYGKMSLENLLEKVQQLAATYCKSVMRHQGDILSIPQDQQNILIDLQKKSDEQDTIFLNAKKRDSSVQGPCYVNQVTVSDKKTSVYSKPNTMLLENGLEVVWLDNNAVDTIELVLELKADAFYDDERIPGLYKVMSQMMMEGTKDYPGLQFAQELENSGIMLTVAPGQIVATCLKSDFEKMIAMVSQVLKHVIFDPFTLDKIKEQAQEHLKLFWDTPTQFHQQLARNIVYKNHPYHKQLLGRQESIVAITRQDCLDFYHKNIVPDQARLAIVGNLQGFDVAEIIENNLGDWNGSKIEDLPCAFLEQVTSQQLVHHINRNQIVLAFVGLSVDRNHSDYNAIRLFDQILAGSIMPSMSTRIFALRQKSGLFYTAGGSLLHGAGNQPGMIFIRTIVSPDRVQEAEQAFLDLLDTAVETLTQDELDEAKRILLTSYDALYDSNAKRASAFLFLKKYGFDFDYFAQQQQAIQNITVKDVQVAVRKILSKDKLAVIRIGRV